MVVITVQAYVEVGNKKLFCVKMIDVQKRLGLKNMSDLVKKEICGIFETKNPTKEQKKKYGRTESEITKKSADDFKYKYARSDLMEKIIKNCRGVKQCNDGVNRLEKEEQRENFRTILGFKEHGIMKVTEKTTLDSIERAFEGEHIQTHYRVLGYEIDIYFYDYKLAAEIDEKDHQDRDISREIERQKALEKELGCKFIRINPEKENFNIFKAQNEIFRHIKESNKESTKELTKKYLIVEISNKLLKLEFKKYNSIKTKSLKHVVEKILPTLLNKHADLLFKVQQKKTTKNNNNNNKEYRCKNDENQKW